MSNVIDLPVITKLDINPDKVLQKAIGEVKEVIIIGYDNNDEFYFGSSKSGVSELNLLLDIAKKRLLDAFERGELQ
jgi:hypothetical protein